MTKLTNNFNFLKNDNFKINKKEDIILWISDIEGELLKAANDEPLINGMNNIRKIYELILMEINNIFDLNTDPKKSSTIFKNFIKKYSGELSSRESLSFKTASNFGNFGSHADLNGDNKFHKHELLTALEAIWYLLILIYKNNQEDIKDNINRFLPNLYESNDEKPQINIETNHEINEFTSHLLPIHRFFAKKNLQYFIPIYQRGYTWKKDNIITFLSDIKARNEDQSDHYFGVIACKKNTQNIKEFLNNTKNKIKIIDGQQRLTTSMLFQCAVRDVLKEKNSHGKYKILDELYLNDRDIKEKFFNACGKASENKAFEEILSISKPTNPKSNIYINYKLMKDELMKKSEEDIVSLFSTFIHKFKVAYVEFKESWKTKKEMEVFENINSKGKFLSSFDLFKNFLFNLCSESVIEEKEQELVTQFNIYFENLVNRNDDDEKNKLANEFMTTIIKYFSDEEIDSGIDEGKKTYRLFSKIVLDQFVNSSADSNGLTLDEYIVVLKKINKYFSIFYSFKNLNDSNLSSWMEKIFGLKMFLKTIQSGKITPIILVGYYFFDLLHTDVDSFSNSNKKWNFALPFFLNLIKPLCFNALIIKQGSNKPYTYYSDELKNARKKINISIPRDNELIQLSKDVETKINQRLNKNEVSNFRTLLISTDRSADWAIKTTLLLFEWKIGNYFNNEQAINRNKIELEHIMPQNIEKWKKDIMMWNNISNDEDLQKADSYLNKFGNYLILSKKLNVIQSNKPFKEKLEKLREDNSPLFKNSNDDIDLSRKQIWTFGNIENRSKAIFSKLLEIFENELSQNDQ